jgi:ABC-type branched-subunit amino acid transport system substrate-binding protein
MTNPTEQLTGHPAIKIGVVVATRGPAALLGSSFVKAVQLAKEELKNTKHEYGL